MEPGRWEGLRKEFIGPHQLEGRRLWFGKAFGSGDSTGVGAFGYFDLDKRDWTLYSPREVGPWSTSAFLVEPDALWLGLVREYDEGDILPGGLGRWDRQAEKFQHPPFDWTTRRFVRHAGVLYLGADEGLAIMHGPRIEKYIVSMGRSGYEVVAVTPKP